MAGRSAGGGRPRGGSAGSRASRTGRGGGSRQPTVILKTARGRTASSQRWLERQLNDPYVTESKRLGYRSRAAFKLLQLDEKFGFLKPGARIVDLGAAPGGWTQVAVQKVAVQKVAVEKVGAPGGGQVVGLDILPVEPIAGATLLQADFTEDSAPALLRQALDGPVDAVLSDMAASATGHAKTDHIRVVLLCELALDFALEVLAPGGTFVAKVFQGGSEGELLARMKQAFRSVRHFKPAASRAESPETYVVAMGFRGGGEG